MWSAGFVPHHHFCERYPKRRVFVTFFVQERLCSELREEKVSSAPCLPLVVDVERGKRLIDVGASCFLSNHLTF